MGDVISFRRQLSTTSLEAFELEITVNYPVHTWMENGSFMRNLTSWSVPFWLVLLTEHIRVLHCYATNVVCRCLVTGQLNPSCGFSSAHCRCFQVSIPCLAIHLTAFAHYTALKDSDFLVRIASSCEIFMILFNFYWCLSLDSFRR